MRPLFALGAVIVLSATSLSASAAEVAFKPAEEEGYFNFDTGAVRGKLRLDGKLQGIPELIHTESGVEVTYGGGHAGLLSPYRVFSTDTRYGHAARDWPSVPKLLADGAVEVYFPPGEDHPLEMTAIYRWAAPDTLDVETIVKPQQEMPHFEVFWSNYFGPEFEVSVYVQPPRKSPGEGPAFVPADFCPLMEDNYLMFPRDREAVGIIFDRRWEQPPAPVQWCVTRYMAAPLAVRRHKPSGVTALVMAPPEDCFAVATPYNRTPPDKIAGHQSVYLSLFGRDVEEGQTVRASTRLVVKAELSDEEALKLYEAYLKQRER